MNQNFPNNDAWQEADAAFALANYAHSAGRSREALIAARIFVEQILQAHGKSGGTEKSVDETITQFAQRLVQRRLMTNDVTAHLKRIIQAGNQAAHEVAAPQSTVYNAAIDSLNEIKSILSRSESQNTDNRVKLSAYGSFDERLDRIEMKIAMILSRHEI